MSSLCRMCGDEAEITTSLLDTSRHHLQWAINHFEIELDGVLPTSVCLHCDEIIRQWTLFLGKREKANSSFSTMIAYNLSLIQRLTSDTSNTSEPSKPSTSLCSALLSDQVSNILPENNINSIKSIINANFTSIINNSSFTTPIEAIYIPDIKSEIDLDECEISMEVSSKNHDADKQLSIQIENPLNTASSSLPGTDRLQHPQEPRQLTSETSNILLEGKSSFSDRSTFQFPISANPSSASLSDLNLLQRLVKKYHIKNLTVRMSRLSDQVLDSLQQIGAVDCNVVDNQMSEQRNEHIQLEPVIVDPCVCDDQVSDSLQLNLSSTVDDDDDDIEVPFEAIYDPVVKCELDLVKTEQDSNITADQSENQHLDDNSELTVEQEKLRKTKTDVQPDIPDLQTSQGTSNPSSKKAVNIITRVFTCAHCNFTTNCRSKFAYHIFSQHVRSSNYQCQECIKSYKHKGCLNKHMGVAHPDKCSYKCLLCKRGFQLERHLLAHIESHDKKYQCDVCGKILSRKQRLTEHIMTIHTRSSPLPCGICSKIFYTDESLKKHKKIMHSNISYKCDVCDKSFKLKLSLRIHQLEVHASVRSFSCSQCKKTFVSKATLKRHSFVHSDLRPFKCESCGLGFHIKGYLRKHLRIVHSNVRAFKCHLCGKSFKCKGSLKRHLFSHSDVRNFKCEQCGKLFKTKTVLKRHLTSHSELRPFACAQCNKKFNCKLKIVGHFRQVHSDLRPFSCDKCSYACKSKSDLNKHQVVHSNVRKFECYKCKSKFKYRSGLSIHIKIKHSNLYRL